MKTKHYCRKCGHELSIENVSPGYAFVCPECDENMYGIEADDRYFPDNPANKVYAVDAYVTVCKCMKIEAASKAEAERDAEAKMLSLVFSQRNDADMIRALADMGFQDAEETEYKVSGEANENGEIEYY